MFHDSGWLHAVEIYSKKTKAGSWVVLGLILILLPLFKMILIKCLLMWIASKRFQNQVFKFEPCPRADHFEI